MPTSQSTIAGIDHDEGVLEECGSGQCPNSVMPEFLLHHIMQMDLFLKFLYFADRLLGIQVESLKECWWRLSDL